MKPGASNIDGTDSAKVTDHNFGQTTEFILATLDEFTRVDTLDALWDVFIKLATYMEMDLLSYHHQGPAFGPNHVDIIARTHGFPEDWSESYFRKKQHITDPITQVFSTRVRPMLWSEVDDIVPLTPAQTDYLMDLRSWLKGDGLGLPVFGPGGRVGYVGIGRKARNLDDLSVSNLNRIHWSAQSFHMRWCEISILQMPKDFTLNEREVLILKNVGHGVSDEVICGIVGASIDSVQQSIRNIMTKMGVSDRASAVLRGVGSGLLDPESVILK